MYLNRQLYMSTTHWHEQLLASLLFGGFQIAEICYYLDCSLSWAIEFSGFCDLGGLLRWGWKQNHESWIIVTKNVRIMNLCFKNLGIMNLCTSALESWITRLWEKLKKMHVWINCVRSRECRIWRFREYNFQNFFRGSVPPGLPLYNSSIRSWQLACFSSNSGG